jgi:Tol biopolymer transport system component
LLAIDIKNRALTKAVEFDRRASLSSVATSPDRTQVAVAVYVASTERGDLGGADIYVVDLATGTQQMVVPHGASGVWLNEPAWSADGKSIYFTRRAAIMQDGRYRGEEVSIRRVNLDGSDESLVVSGASSPSLSADGQFLAYLGPVGGAQPASLWVANPEGQQARKLTDQTFIQVGTPRFAPGGSQLAFTAVGGPNIPVQLGAARNVFGALFSPRVAEAHGIPWDLWVVNADGSGLRRVTDVGEDAPVPAWSPDGASIAFSGEVGIYIVTLATSVTVMVAEEPSSGVVWVTG